MFGQQQGQDFFYPPNRCYRFDRGHQETNTTMLSSIRDELKNISNVLQQQTIILQSLQLNMRLMTDHIHYMPGGLGYQEAENHWFAQKNPEEKLSLIQAGKETVRNMAYNEKYKKTSNE